MNLLDSVGSMEHVGSLQPLGLMTLCTIGLVAYQGQEFILARHLDSDPEESEEKEHDEEPNTATATPGPNRSSRASDEAIKLAELRHGQEEIHETLQRQVVDIRTLF